jgi:Ser/Thr protein kinase RdoA (MazF antagonist)
MLRPGTRDLLAWFALALLAGILIGRLAGGDVPSSPNQAHAYADGILAPRFHAAVNEFEFHHPRDKTPGAWDHVLSTDKGDAERWREVVDAWEIYHRAMKTAGYK